MVFNFQNMFEHLAIQNDYSLPVGKADRDAYTSSQNVDYIKVFCKLFSSITSRVCP